MRLNGIFISIRKYLQIILLLKYYNKMNKIIFLFMVNGKYYMFFDKFVLIIQQKV